MKRSNSENSERTSENRTETNGRVGRKRVKEEILVSKSSNSTCSELTVCEIRLDKVWKSRRNRHWQCKMSGAMKPTTLTALFVFNPTFGAKEGTEDKKILAFYPKVCLVVSFWCPSVVLFGFIFSDSSWTAEEFCWSVSRVDSVRFSPFPLIIL